MKKSLGPKTILYPTPVLLIGSYDKNGQANAMTASWAGICCSQPPCIMVSLRKATYTYDNLIERKAFTANVPSEKYITVTDYCGIVTGRNENKLAKAGLTPVASALVDAPYIQEFPLILECKVIQTIQLGLHTQFIGEILDVKVDETYVDPLGLPDIEKIKPFSFAPEHRRYYATGKEIGKAFATGKDLGVAKISETSR